MNKNYLTILSFVLLMALTFHRQIPSINPVNSAILLGLSTASQKPEKLGTISTAAKSLPLIIKKSIKPIMFASIFYGMSVAAYNANYTYLCEYSLSFVSLGNSYKYSQIDNKALFHIQKNSMINKIIILTSPLQMFDNLESHLSQQINYIKNQSYIEQIMDIGDFVILNIVKSTTNYVKKQVDHWEIALEIQNLVYLVFSFGADGLQNVFYGHLQHILNRRKDNEILFQKEVNFGMQTLKDYLQLNENKKYHPIYWNCKSFVKGMMEHLGVKIQPKKLYKFLKQSKKK